MRVVVASIFRNSMDYMDRYWDQVFSLRDKYDLRCALTEGDSTDGTKDFVWAWNGVCADGYQFATVDHGGPHFGSVDHEPRWQQIAQVVRPTIQRALELEPEVVLYVESDLIWDTETMTQLIDRTAAAPGRTSAPMLLASDNPERFYDTWGYRLNGQQFRGMPPYWDGDDMATHPKIDSCGNCFATNNLEELASWDGHWPYPSRNMRLQTDLIVRHP